MKLHAWQADALAWMRGREAAAGPTSPGGGVLADDVGMGKTAVAAALVAGDAAAGGGPSLVVAPKSLLSHWACALREAGAGDVAVVHRPSAAAAAGAGRAAVVVASYSCWTSTRRRPPPELAGRDWARVVMDEAHCAKNPRGLTHAGLRALRSPCRWALTATPLQNHAGELAALARLVGFDTDDPALLAREGLMLRRVAAGAAGAGGLALPGLVVADVELEFRHAHERELYGRVREETARALALAAKAAGACGASGASGAFASARRQMEVELRLRQAATHPAVYHASMARKRGVPHDVLLAHMEEAAREPPLPSTKFDYVCESLAAHPDERALVFVEWASEMDLLARYLVARGLPAPVLFHGRLSVEAREAATLAFRAADPPAAMLVNVKCGACGLNLQAASRVYLMRGQWNPALEAQAIGRAHRQGQARDVRVERLSVAGTADARVGEVRRAKLRGITAALRDDTLERRLAGRCAGRCAAHHAEGEGEGEGEAEAEAEA